MIGQLYYDKLREEAFARNSFNNGFIPNTTRRVKHTRNKIKEKSCKVEKSNDLKSGYMVFKNSDGYVTRLSFNRGVGVTYFDKIPLPITPSQYIVYAKSVRGLDFVGYENSVGVLAK